MEPVAHSKRATALRWQHLAVAAFLGLTLWFGLVVVPEDTGGSAFLWSSLLAATAFGLKTSTTAEAWQVGVGLAGPGLVLALWTAPRGDNDGLWLLWLPILACLALYLALTAWLVGRLVKILRRHSDRA
jgi:hypothetical protein